MKTQLLLVVVLAVALCHMSDATPSAVYGSVKSVWFTSSTCNSTACASIRYSGATTNLTNIPTISGLPPGPYNITYSGLQTAIYAVSDDSVNYVNVNTTCILPDQPSNAIDFTNSYTYTNTTTGRLRLHLKFTQNYRYYAFAYRYAGNGGARCNSSVTNLVNNNYQYWQQITNGTGVGCTDESYEIYEHDFNDALTNCGYARDETDPNNTAFSSNIIVTTTDTGVVIRGNRYTRSLDTGLSIKITFRTNVTATVNITVFGQTVTQAVLTGQFWDPVNLRATLRIYTSVQWPYALSNPVMGYDATNWNAPQVLNQTSPCYNNVSAVQTVGDICGQTWYINISRSVTCGSSSYVALNGSWTMNFTIGCSPLYNGSNCTQVGGVATITFNTDSTNYCPQLIGTSSSTAVLTSYQDSAYTTTQTQFVFGTTTYFAAVLTSPIKTDWARAEYIYITQGGSVGSTSPIYQRPFTNASNYWGAAVPAPTYGTFNSLLFSDSGTTNLVVTDSNSPGNFTQRVTFSLRWQSYISNATGDNPKSTTLQINLRIRYTNQSTSGGSDVVTLTFKPLDVDTLSANTNVLVTGDSGTGVGPTGSAGADAGSSSSLSMSVVAVVAGAVGGIALLSAFTIILLRRRQRVEKQKQEDTAPVELDSSSTHI